MEANTKVRKPAYGAKRRRPISFKKVEGGLEFLYSDGTTKFHPNPPSLMTLPLPQKPKL